MHATLTLCATAIIFSIAGWTHPGMDPFVLDARAFADEPWRLVTSHFLHANILHLYFNLSWIWYLGREIEQRLGQLMLLGTTLFMMLGTSAAERAFDRGAIGLSGVVYGLWALCFIGEKRCHLLSGILTKKTNQLMIVWFFFCILMTWTGTLPISNWGHGAGAVLGALVGFSLGEVGLPRPFAYPLGSALLALLGAGATVFWPKWNFGGAAIEFERKADEALKESDWKAAEAGLRAVIELDRKDERTWWNLGCALAKLGRDEEAVEACYRSFECGGLEKERLESVKEQVGWLRDRYDFEGNTRSAFVWAQHLVKVVPDDKQAWRDLQQRAESLGDKDWSERARNALAKLDPKK